MPEAKKYRCINIGIDTYPVWLLLSDKTAIVAIAPCNYDRVVPAPGGKMILATAVTLAQSGCVVEVLTPVSVNKVMEALGVSYADDIAVADQDAKPEAVKPPAEGGAS